MAVRAQPQVEVARILCRDAAIRPTAAWRGDRGQRRASSSTSCRTTRRTGARCAEALAQYDGQDITALVIQQPNFFGVLEDVDALTALGARATARS